MAKLYYGLNRGQHDTDIQSGSSDLGTDVELVVDTTKITTRDDVIVLLKNIEIKLMSDAGALQ